MTSTTETTQRFLRMVRRFEASPERVFAAWTDPEVVKKWLFTGPTSEAHTNAHDVRVGGRWTIMDQREGKQYTAEGTYLEVDPPRKLVLTFGMPQFSPNTDTLTIEIVPDGDGAIMTFTQEGVDIAEELRALAAGHVGGTEQGWIWMFMGLEAALK